MRPTAWKRLLKTSADPALQYHADVVARAVERRTGAHLPEDSRHTYNSLATLTYRYGWQQSSLSAAEHKVFSQNGEDGVLAELFHRVGTTNRYFVEFGVESGIEGNAVLLADVLGWNGLFLEADVIQFARLNAKYSNNPRVQTQQAVVTAKNIESLLSAASVPTDFDLLSIDVDGEDYMIWKAITTFHPRILVIEYNSGLPWHSRQIVSPDDMGRRIWDQTAYFGCSLGALTSLATEKGYRLVHLEMTGTNAFFLRADLWEAAGAPEVIGRSPNIHLRGLTHPEDHLGRSFQEP